MDWKRMLGIRRREVPIAEIPVQKVMVEGDSVKMIYKPERRYLDENGEVKIPEEAIAVERKEEVLTVKEGGEVLTSGVRIYYTFLMPVSEEEEPELEQKEEKKPAVVVRRR
ncbi:MAG: hypothetical protein Sv326_1322 (plasmid) [Candidatus Fermentimicrarchaeum limneticum]|uniref:Uncharacterized protein n=1 Tax=Fermentimicrarchaeum limneticum TaxID=2795018 RepID=A0A7D6BB43_FERL1|nr:MAG: hypothetical protein Sv326_1322 [Candidatus Fermentimicrarchaeum limneticum]